jgi:glutathione peroxidase
MVTAYDFSARLLDGSEISLNRFRGSVLLVVNTASKCTFTPQYSGLEKLYRTYNAQGFEVLAFPCNQFGGQEPADSEAIGKFCSLLYNVTFPIFAKVEVNGTGAHPLFAFLKSAKPGSLGTKAIKWNFTKFLVNRDGIPAGRYAPRAVPAKLQEPVEALL